ncbi:MAG: hypothetical protein U0670_13990 [Anaerolineae bacterium]
MAVAFASSWRQRCRIFGGRQPNHHNGLQRSNRVGCRNGRDEAGTTSNITAMTQNYYSNDRTRVAIVDGGMMTVSIRDAASGDVIADLPQTGWVMRGT